MDLNLFNMKPYSTTHAKHIVLCLVYCALTCVQQVTTVQHNLFYSVYPFLTLYYGVLSIPKIHIIHEYNTVEHTVPKWTYVMRAYYHIVLLEPIPFAGILTIFVLIIIMMWKDTRFLVNHAEERLKRIDEGLYGSEYTKKYRIAHLHLDTFDDDTAVRNHTHLFNTNKIVIVQHSLQSEESQNGIRNYVEYKRQRKKKPQNLSEWEEKLWRASDYKHIFIQNRDMYTFVPLIYILCGTFISFTFLEESKLRLIIHLNTVLMLGYVISTLLMTKLNNNICIDALYLCSSLIFLLFAAKET